ncbi:MAG: roadblock/LC7 domain-containing protein [Gammaproteobacteria bacterium]
MTKQEQLEQLIEELRNNVPDITGVMVASSDGLSIASDFAEEEGARIAAVGAAAAGLGNRIAQNASLGDVNETMIKGSESLLLIYPAGDGVLAIRAPALGNLGLVRLEAGGTCQQVKDILNPAVSDQSQSSSS